MDKTIDSVRAFWNLNPCDGQSNISQRMRFRYCKEPWLMPLLETIAFEYESLLEIGCGQGADSIYICSHKKNGSYIGIDVSDKSIENSKMAAKECADELGVFPFYQVGNAECLEFPDSSFDAIYSCGVLHHSPNTNKAIKEVYRVLKQGGTGYIYLYRFAFPKVFTAHLIRIISRCLDIITFQDRLIWRVIRRLEPSYRFGTMLLECFGVPIFRSYTKWQIKQMFSFFSEVEISIPGTNVSNRGVRRIFSGYRNLLLGTVWQIRCKK